jgi:HEAT repeat protein
METKLVEILLKAADDPDANVRRAVAIALADGGSNHAKSAIVKLAKDKVWQVREAAITSLGKAKVVEAADLLLKVLGCDDEASARKAILQWVSAKGDEPVADAKPKAPGGMPSGEAKKPAGDPWQVKKAAALTLSHIRPDLAVVPLLNALSTDNPAVKLAAMAGLGSLNAQEAVEPLLELLSASTDWNIRKAAATTLGKLKAESAVDALLNLLEDERFAVRIEVVIALNHIKPPEAVSAFSKVVVSDNNYEVRKVAATALGNLKSQDAIPALLKALEDENWIVRKAAVDSLTNLKASEGMDKLIERLVDEQEDVRSSSAVAVMRLAQS